MEGVPKLYMLRTSLKTSPERTDFSRKIKWVCLLLPTEFCLCAFIIVDDSPCSKSENILTKILAAMPMKPENWKLFELQPAIHPRTLLAARY